VWVNQIQLAITKHAIQRMIERGCNPKDVILFLRRINGLILLKNHRGYEIIIPFKGRLVGDFEGKTFVVKSFLLPTRFAQDYYLNDRKSRDGYLVTVSSVSFPKIESTILTQAGYH